VKISLFSDVHIEFDKPPMIDNPGADVLILSGDIFPIHTIFEHPDHPLVDVFRAFIKHCCENWNSVVYVMGNHEFYHGDIHDDVDALKDNLAEYENLFILDDEWVIIDGVKFIGSTLWTDANNENPLTQEFA
jgi:UDP-2,3-diacylglucosamine pyrophosphatase LpxH